MNKNLMFDIAVYFYQNYGISMDDIAFERHQVGFNICIREKGIELYVRFWERCAKRNGFPDKCIILVWANFASHEKRKVRDLAKFLNQIGPRYGYEFLAIEDYYILNDYLGLMEIEGNPTPCYLAPLGKELAEQLEG